MFYSKRDLKFNLYELLNVGELNKYSYYEDHSSETFDLVLESAGQIAEKMLLPLLTEMDRDEPQLVDGKIKVHEGMKAIVQKFGDDGWINATFSYDDGGQQLPALVHNAAAFVFNRRIIRHQFFLF
jgi:alkylation response protein AidB-like acyl-CoA dehydrogenase